MTALGRGSLAAFSPNVETVLMTRNPLLAGISDFALEGLSNIATFSTAGSLSSCSAIDDGFGAIMLQVGRSACGGFFFGGGGFFKIFKLSFIG